MWAGPPGAAFLSSDGGAGPDLHGGAAGRREAGRRRGPARRPYFGAELVRVLLLYALVSWQVLAHEPPLGSLV